ncbi:unnamed protein product [Paramecium sonneborni]|uniref:Uncharacterized protein n=1 Tax=Paramecium sonneborni TaxID=65129 RepID=A0A8S1R6W0_9CILI|nr:unnamed protein product [Paramecium sonneborni]
MRSRFKKFRIEYKQYQSYQSSSYINYYQIYLDGIQCHYACQYENTTLTQGKQKCPPKIQFMKWQIIIFFDYLLSLKICNQQ